MFYLTFPHQPVIHTNTSTMDDSYKGWGCYLGNEQYNKFFYNNKIGMFDPKRKSNRKSTY